MTSGSWKTSFYGYDGHDSVRFLTDEKGTKTDSYDYDAFGILISKTGTTPNIYLYAGEQWDQDLGLYYNRARYLNTNTGRFFTKDSFEGHSSSPRSLHKYVYTHNDPVDNSDPSGKVTLTEQAEILAVRGILFVTSTPVVTGSRVVFAGLNFFAALSDPEGFVKAYVESGGNPSEIGGVLLADVKTLIGARSRAKNIIRLRYTVGNLEDFYYKTENLASSTTQGNVIVISATGSIRSRSVQQTFRKSVIDAYANDLVHHFGLSKEAGIVSAKNKFSTFDVDHLLDLQVSGALSNPNDARNLGMIDSSVNRSLGSQIKNEINRLGLKEGDTIHGVIIDAPPRP